jgi:ATP-binding cassette subfamily C (CFTR/MRP) protein 5
MGVGGGVGFYVFVLSLFMIAMLSKGFSDLFLSYWIGQGDGNTYEDGSIGSLRDNPNFKIYALIYGMSGLGFLLLQVSCCL